MPRGRMQQQVGKTFLACLLITGTVQSQNLISQIGWKGAEPGIIWGVVFILSFSLVLLSLLYVGNRRRALRDEEELSIKLFSEACNRADLNEQEIQTLKTLLSYEKGLKPHVIFEFIGIYEKCVDAYVDYLFGLDLSPEQFLEEEIVLKNLRNKMGFNFLPPEHPLISTRNISVGQKVSIFTQSSKVPLARNCTVTLINEGGFTVQAEDDQKSKLLVNAGTELLIAFTRQCDGVYSVVVKVKSCEMVGKLEFFHTLDFSRNQMRNHVRMEVNLPLRLRIVDSPGSESGKVSSQKYTCRIVEVGGGGLSFFHNEPLKLGDVLLLSLQLPNGIVSGIRAKVLRISFLEGKTTEQYKHSVQFLHIDPRDREQIVHFIFEKQRQVNQMR
ncbi:MAG: flagellar brake protein [Chitinispirillaceae bacterium]